MDASTVVGKWISDLVYLGGNGIAWLVYLFVGMRLYGLGRRTRQLPEYLIAACFLLWTLSYLFYDIPYAIFRADELVPPACAYASVATLAFGNVAFALFIRAVFRPGSRWATGLVAAVALCAAAGLVGSAWFGDWEGIDPLANPGYWLDLFGSFAPTVWLTAEGFAQYSRARRRLKLGLSEPMACNRFLLWGVAGGLWMILEGFATANDFVMAFTGRWSELLNFAIALFEAVPVVVIWFAFFPPAFYCRWIEGGGKRAEAPPSGE